MDDKWINRNLRREFRIPGWLLVAYFALMNVLVMVEVFVGSLQETMKLVAKGDFSAVPDMEAVMSNAWGYLLSVGIALLFLFVWKDRSFWKKKVLKKSGKMTPGLFGILICAAIAVQFLNSFWVMGLEAFMNLFDKSIMEALESVSGSSDSVSMFLYASIAAPVSEELIFRGYIQRDLERYGRKFAIFCSAVLFGVFHGNLIQIPYAFLMGLLLGYVAAQYHIGWAIVLHMFNNLVLADLMTRATAGLPEEVVGAINMILFGIGALITGVVIIIKRKAILSYIRQEWMDRRCLKCFFLNSGMIVLMLLMAANSLTILLMA